jgi:streptogramin lyase
MWLQPDGGDLLAVAPSGQLSDVGQSGVDQQDLTLGPDGALYVADSSGNAIDRCAVTSRPSATCTQIAVPAAFSDQSPAAISSAGGELFYATGDGELGSLTPAGVIGNPFADPSWSQVTLAASPRSMAGKAGGMLYAAAADASAAMGQNDALAAIDPLTGSVTAVFGPGNGMPAGASVGAVAAGPDGNIWFTDTYNTAIGELNLTSGRITEFPLPGDATFDTGSTALAAGPAGSAALFFPVLSASNKPELGEVSLATVTGSQGSSGSTGSSGSAGSSGSGGTVGSSGSQAHGTAGGTRSSHSAKHKRIRHKRHRRHSRHGRR